MLRGFWLFFICCLPLYLHAQTAAELTDPPLPQLKDFHMVVRIRELFPFPGTGRTKIVRDTESVFIIGPDGYAMSRMRARNGQCAGVEKLKVENGQITCRERFVSVTQHSLYASLSQHVHQIKSRDTWEYRQGRIFRERNYAGPDEVFTREVRYDYDESGRIVNISYLYPKQRLIYYAEQFDARQFEYAGDSVFEWKYRLGRIADSLRFVARYENGQRTYWRFATSAGLQQEERCRYDSTGKICLNEWESSESAIENGSIRRPDKIEYRYDKQGRIEEIRCFIRGLRCEAYYYSYLR